MEGGVVFSLFSWGLWALKGRKQSGSTSISPPQVLFEFDLIDEDGHTDAPGLLSPFGYDLQLASLYPNAK